MVGRDGFEPSKAEPTGLQPVPFGHSGTDPERETLAERRCLPETNASVALAAARFGEGDDRSVDDCPRCFRHGMNIVHAD